MEKVKRIIKLLFFIIYTFLIIFLCCLVSQNKNKQEQMFTTNVIFKTNTFTKIFTNRITIIQSNENAFMTTNFVDVVLTNWLIEVEKEKLKVNKYMVGVNVSYPVGVGGLFGVNIHNNYYILLGGGVVYTNYYIFIGVGYGF